MSGEPSDYFDALYGATPDPWNYATSPYEAEKYAATLAALPAGHFGEALEVGCSIGILSHILATRCARLLAIDISGVAIRHARQRQQVAANIRFERGQIPRDWPEQTFDLMVFSEVLYYLSDDDIAAAAAKSIDSLAAGGTTVLVNWLGPTGACQTGDQAADRFIRLAQPRLRPSNQRRTAHYRIDILGH